MRVRSSTPSPQSNTHIGMVGVGDLDQTTRQCGGQTHGLGTLIPSGVLPGPIHHPHPHEVVQDPISENHRIAGMKLFDNADSISPQTIVEVTFVEDIVDPMLLAETLLSQKDHSVQHPGINLTYHQLST